MTDKPSPKILHIINSLGTGGAEMMLCKLLENRSLDHVVLTLKSGGALRERAKASGAEIYDLGISGKGLKLLRNYAKLEAIVRGVNPDIVQGWMYHGNLAASLAFMTAKRGQKPKIVWNVRHSLHDIRFEKWGTRTIIWLGKLLAKRTSKILYNSALSAKQHEKYGFPAAKTKLIPNGFDLEIFRPDPEARARLCSELNIPPQRKLFCHIARFHPMKDHELLLRAFGLLHNLHPDVHLILIGRDVTMDNPELSMWIKAAKVEGHVSCLGQRHDIPQIWPGVDFSCLSSAWGEGFPNVLGEAMASGVPCVSTDVGDAGWVIGEHGELVSPGDPAGYSAAMTRCVQMDKDTYSAKSENARNWIADNFSISRVVGMYEGFYEELSAN